LTRKSSVGVRCEKKGNKQGGQTGTTTINARRAAVTRRRRRRRTETMKNNLKKTMLKNKAEYEQNIQIRVTKR